MWPEIGDLLCQGEFQDWWSEGKGLGGSGVVEFKRFGGGEALGWDPIPKFDEPKGLKLLFNPNGLIWLKPKNISENSDSMKILYEAIVWKFWFWTWKLLTRRPYKIHKKGSFRVFFDLL